MTDASPTASILGLANGLQPVVNGGGAMTILAANSALAERSGIISTYKVDGATGALHLGDSAFSGSQIGVSVDIANPCLSSDATILATSDYESWARQTAPRALAQFTDRKLSLASLTVLTATSKFVAAIDAQGRVGVIKLGTVEQSFDSSVGVCEFKPL
ncbi:MAG: hypothetical protein EBZ48_07220 [Proteobacteria bacterium]|nr:hypothetical protein [Pseudomonadota bacterium]